MKAMTSSSSSNMSHVITPRPERTLRSTGPILPGSSNTSTGTSGNKTGSIVNRPEVQSTLEMRKRKLNSGPDRTSNLEQRKKTRLSTTQARKSNQTGSKNGSSTGNRPEVTVGLKRNQPCSPNNSPAASPPHRSQIPRLTGSSNSRPGNQERKKINISDWIAAYQATCHNIINLV